MATRRIDLCTRPCRILKVDIEALTEFSHIHSLNDLNYTLFSQGYVFEMTANIETYIPRT